MNFFIPRNNNTYKAFLNYLIAYDQTNQPGKLFLITGRNTFSAAANFVTEVEKLTSAIFVGEGTGGSPNLYADTSNVILPNSKLVIEVSTRYWEMSTPDDERSSIEPDFPVGLSATEYFNQQDPQLEFILDY